MNSDGTTKNQKKLACLAINDVISVNEIADGSAITSVKDICQCLSMGILK